MGCGTCCAGTRAASHCLSVSGVFPLGTASRPRAWVKQEGRPFHPFLGKNWDRRRGEGRTSLTTLSHMLP